jgi:uncharacterized protein (DUF1697 family)
MIKMERLRHLASACGFKNVRTYIQSGNVIFDASIPATTCAAQLEARLARELGKPISVIVRTAQQLGAILAANPFAGQKGVDEKRLTVNFLNRSPAPDRLKALAEVKSGRDSFAVRGKEVYLHCPDGYGMSKLAASLERVLGVVATARNWNTVTKLLEMAII